MNMAEKIDKLMLAHGMNRRQLAGRTGVPYTTIDGWFKRGAQNAQLANVRRVADYFSVKLDWLVDDAQEGDPEEAPDVAKLLAVEMAQMDDRKLERMLEYAKFVNATAG